jgi:hypothetical protein
MGLQFGSIFLIAKFLFSLLKKLANVYLTAYMLFQF